LGSPTPEKGSWNGLVHRSVLPRSKSFRPEFTRVCSFIPSSSANLHLNHTVASSCEPPTFFVERYSVPSEMQSRSDLVHDKKT
jgi:hypothetical protein